MFFDCSHLANTPLAFVQWKEGGDEVEALLPKGANTQDIAACRLLLNSRNSRFISAAPSYNPLTLHQTQHARFKLLFITMAHMIEAVFSPLEGGVEYGMTFFPAVLL